MKVEVDPQRHRILEEAGNVVAWTVSHYLAGAEALCSSALPLVAKLAKQIRVQCPFHHTMLIFSFLIKSALFLAPIDKLFIALNFWGSQNCLMSISGLNPDTLMINGAPFKIPVYVSTAENCKFPISFPVLTSWLFSL